MPNFTVKNIVRRVPYAIFPLVRPKPTDSIADYDFGLKWCQAHVSELTLGTIWTLRGSNGLSQLDASQIISSEFWALAGDFAKGRIGTKLPPFRYPQFKPTCGSRDTIRIWRPDWRPGGAWVLAFARELQDDQLWWPDSGFGEDVYGRPMSPPVPV